MNKYDQTRNSAQTLQQQFPNSNMSMLILASVLFREKKFQKCEEALLLINTNANSTEGLLLVQLTLAQFYLSQNQIQKAIATLQSIASLKHRLGLVSILVNLYEQLNDVISAVKILDESVSYWENQKSDKKRDRILKIAYKANAALKLRYGKYSEAATVYERLVKLDKTDQESLASLIIAYSYFNPELAEQYEKSLPVISASIDAESLENLPASRFLSRQKQEDEKKDQQQDQKAEKKVKKVDSDAKKKKKKKKKRLPKNYDPNVPADAERWLPKHERSYFKRGRGKKKEIGKGSQGAVEKSGSGSNLVQISESKDSPKASDAPAENKPKQPPPAKKPKKNKGKKF